MAAHSIFLAWRIPWTVVCHAPLSIGFSRQEYWNGLPCPPPGDLPDAGIEPVPLTSPALAGRFFTTSATWEAPLPRASDANDLTCVFTHVSVLDFPGGSDSKASVYQCGTRLPWRPTRGSLTSPSYLVRNRTLGPPLENNPEIPPSSRDEGLRLLHGLETNLATSLQTPQEA